MISFPNILVYQCNPLHHTWIRYINPSCKEVWTRVRQNRLAKVHQIQKQIKIFGNVWLKRLCWCCCRCGVGGRRGSRRRTRGRRSWRSWVLLFWGRDVIFCFGWHVTEIEFANHRNNAYERITTFFLRYNKACYTCNKFVINYFWKVFQLLFWKILICVAREFQ